MTAKYERVLSHEEKQSIIDSWDSSFMPLGDLLERTEQATLAKLQPQLDAIGAGGVSGRLMRVVTPTSLVDADLAIALYQVVEKELLDIEMCFENFDTPHQAINALIEWHVNVPKELSLKANPNENPVCYVEPACTIEAMGGYRVCKDGDGFPVYRYPHIPEGYKLVPIDHNYVVMGNGNVAVGECTNAIDGTKGIIYLSLPDNLPKIIGQSCEDIYPVGSEAEIDKVLACISFKTEDSVKQTIGILQGLLPFSGSTDTE